MSEDQEALQRYVAATGADRTADERFSGLARPTSEHRPRGRRYSLQVFRERAVRGAELPVAGGVAGWDPAAA